MGNKTIWSRLLNFVKLTGYHCKNETDFWNPTGLAFNSDQNEMVIADSFNHCCKVIDSQTGNYSRSSINLIDLNTPRDLCFNNDKKNILISDSGNHQICILSQLNQKENKYLKLFPSLPKIWGNLWLRRRVLPNLITSNRNFKP